MNDAMLSRRGLLLAGGLGLAAGLTACASPGSPSSPAPSPTAAGGGSAGGTLRAAFVGAGAQESLNILLGPTALDSVRMRAVHGQLGAIDPSGQDGVRLGVAEQITAADDLSSYTITLRSGVRFTDGSVLTAADVLHSLQLPMVLPALPYLQTVGQNFDLDSARVLDDLTIELPTLQPIADGALLLCQNSFIVPEGTEEFTPASPSCGPFQIAEFVPGEGTALTRFDDYYGGGTLLDGLELRAIPGTDARVAALQAGDIDFAGDIGPVRAQTLDGNDDVVVESTEAPYLTALNFSMNVNHEPFDDADVRRAFKLAIDRQAIVDTVLYGRGEVGNDLPAKGFPDYAADLPQREYDPEAARDLLRQAGAEGMKVTLTTGSEIEGMNEVSTVVAQHLAEIGVEVELDSLPQGQLYSDMEAYFSSDFVVGYTPATPLLSGYTSTRVAGAPSTFGFDRPDIDELVFAARSTADGEERAAKAREAQQLIWDEGNGITPVFLPSVSARAASVSGVELQSWPNFSEASLS
ncbi:ABC transporter substrate-binding protein [Isoptericola croceus]|uniref:ABC transporter substrate-binding protein n=1 Tax=Isoptericola croceus TaxID=3031406 RepID=UPI0023F62713|nr:ABC transporter substrate-binding protein [Isoptericola croceus]